MTIGLTRDPVSGSVILTGCGSEVPQLILRNRRTGKFLTGAGWQGSPGFVPLTAVSDQPGACTLEVDGRTLPPGAPIRLEIPALSVAQETIWPPDLVAIATAIADTPQTPVRLPQVVRAERRPLPKPHPAPRGRGLQIAGAMVLVGFACATAAWLTARLMSDAQLATLQAENATLRASSTQQEELSAERARLEREASQTAGIRDDLAAARLSLENDRKALTADRGQLDTERARLEDEKATLAAERAVFELARQGLTPAAGPSAGRSGLSGPEPDLSGAPGSAAPTPAVREAARQCDLLAANPLDRNRTPGIAGAPMQQLRVNADAAYQACQLASGALPDQLNYRYQWARAIQSTNLDAAVPMLTELTQLGYPAAFDNLALIVLNRDRNTPRAAGLLRQGVARGDPDAMVTLALLIKGGEVRPLPGENYRMLLQQAAALGHPSALLALNDPPPNFSTFLKNLLGR